jgi:hypothetical protein
MNATSNMGLTRLERNFIPQPSNRAAAGVFGRRVFGRAAPMPADPLEVERILARCRARRVEAPAPRPRKRAHGTRADRLAYVATGLSLVALSVISLLPVL